MAKKRVNRFQEDQRKQKKQQQDSLLSVGLASQVANGLNEDEFGSDDSDMEMEYELKPRSLKHEKKDLGALPIKKGAVVQAVVKQADSSDEEEEEEVEQEQPVEQQEPLEDDEDDTNEPDTEEKIILLKEEIAEMIEKLMEEPEENIGALTRLIKMAQSKNPNTARFSLLAIIPALQSIVPAYRIRPLSDAEKKEKVSKDIAKLRTFEQTLVLNYRSYINLLTELCKNSQRAPQMAQLATKAACELAASFKHFNYRPDVLILLIRRICKPSPRNDPVFGLCIKTLETLLNDDDVGDISFDVVRLLTKTLRSRKYRVDESVVNVFLSLQIISDYDPNATEEERAEKMKLKKKDRVHISKKERKARKERKLIEEEMRKAEQKVSEEERERFQAEILKMMMRTYLDILKEKPSNLMASVLEGLAKIGHMANFDLLGDFLEVFREIIKESDDDATREVLLSVATAFALVASHQQFKVTVDLSFFVDSLYAILLDVSTDVDIEFSHKTLRLADPLSIEHKSPSVNISTRIELLLKGLENIFFRSKNGSKVRALAFNKRLAMSLLQTPEKSSIAIIKFLEKLMGRYSELSGSYSTEDRISNGKFLMDVQVPARANAEAATVWETLLLEKHYSPIVAKGAKSLMQRAKEGN